MYCNSTLEGLWNRTNRHSHTHTHSAQCNLSTAIFLSQHSVPSCLLLREWGCWSVHQSFLHPLVVLATTVCHITLHFMSVYCSSSTAHSPQWTGAHRASRGVWGKTTEHPHTRTDLGRICYPECFCLIGFPHANSRKWWSLLHVRKRFWLKEFCLEICICIWTISLYKSLYKLFLRQMTLTFAFVLCWVEGYIGIKMNVSGVGFNKKINKTVYHYCLWLIMLWPSGRMCGLSVNINHGLHDLQINETHFLAWHVRMLEW